MAVEGMSREEYQKHFENLKAENELRRNPLVNRLIVLTRGQKSHNALRAELRFRKVS